MTDAPSAVAPAAAPAKPGKVLGIVAFILAFLPWLQLISLILGIVAKSQSKKAGQKNALASWAIGLSIVFMVLLVAVVFGTVALCNAGLATCSASVG